MGRPALSAGQIEDFRGRLVAVATRLFAHRGYAGVTLRAVAAELGCSPMRPYRYFRDKQAIFAAVRTTAYCDFARAQEEASRSSQEPALRLRALGRAYLAYALAEPDAYRLMFELSQPDPDGYPELREAEARAWLPLRRAVQRAVEAGLLQGDSDVLAHVFWSGVHGLASLRLAGKLRFGCASEDLVEPVLSALFRGNARSPSLFTASTADAPAAAAASTSEA